MKMPSGRIVGSSGWARSLFSEVHSAQATCAGCAFFRFAWRTQVPCQNGELGPGKITLVSEPANNSRVFKRKRGFGGLLPALIGLSIPDQRLVKA